MNLGPNNNIEEIFKSKFEDFSPEVDPKVWNNIQKSIGNSSHSGTPSFFSSLAGKFILGAAAVTITTVSAFMLTGNAKDAVINNNASEPTTTAQNITPDKETKTTAVTPGTTTLTPQDNPGNTNLAKNPVTPQPVKHPDPVSSNNNSNNNVKPLDNSNSNNKPETQNNVAGNTTAVTHQDNNNKEPEHYAAPTHPGMNIPTHNTSANGSGNEEQVTNTVTDNQNNSPLTRQSIANIAFTTSATGGAYAPIAVYFTNKGKAVSQEWNFGDGDFISRETSPSHVYEYPGEYTIVLVATSEDGKTERDSVKLKILSNAFFIPNTFTPNGDGNNDVYKIMKNDSYPYEINNLEIVIFDRTGQKVGAFYSTDIGWDGRNFKTGEMCPQGSYLVVVQYTSSEDGKVHTQRGPVFLKE